VRRNNFEGEGQAIVEYRDSVINSTKTAELIKMLFGMLSHVGQNHVLDGVQMLPREGQF